MALQETAQLLAQLQRSSVLPLAGNLMDNALPCLVLCVGCLWAHGGTDRRSNSGFMAYRFGTNQRACISGEQPAPKLFDALTEHKAQLRQDLPNLRVIVRGESLSTQNRYSFFEFHGKNRGQSALIKLLSTVRAVDGVRPVSVSWAAGAGRS